MPDAGFDAVVLAGGGARRLGGRDKPAAPVGGRSLLARVADAVADARTLVVVGPPRPDVPNARAVREDPPGAGPVPALRTGLAALTSPAPTLALLAADLPFLDATHVEALRAAARAGSGAVLVDENGREQWLAGHWNTEALSEALGTYEGASLHGLLSPLNPVKLKLEPGPRAPWFDCDTPEELAEANALLNQNR